MRWIAIALVLAGCRSGGGVRSGSTLAEPDLGSARAASAQRDWERAAGAWGQLLTQPGATGLEAHSELARTLMAQGRAEDANGVCDLGLTRYPGDPDLCDLKGQALRHLGFRRAAESAFLESLAGGAERPETLLHLGQLRLELGLFQGALEVLNRRCDLGFACAETQWLRGRALQASGRLERAYDAYEASLRLAPVDVERLVDAAEMVLDPRVRGRFERAHGLSRRWLVTALVIDPQFARAQRLLAILHEDAGEADAALAAWGRAAELEPGDPTSLEGLARLHAARGDAERARDLATLALKTSRDPDQRERLHKLTRGDGP